MTPAIHSTAGARPASDAARSAPRDAGSNSFSETLQGWLEGSGEKTVGGLIDVFEEKSFAILFVVLLGVPALPLPTGGATHVFEVIAVLLAIQLVAGRDQIWLPERWRERELAGDKQERFLTALMKMIRRLERISKPRFGFLFNRRLSNIVFGMLVIGGCVAAFLAPPFTGLDTLPALAVVLLSLSVLLEDFAITVVALVIGVVGVALEIFLGKAAVDAVSGLF
jgi:hypothetical protein